MEKNTSIVLASGGTGGHIFPAEALAQELKKRQFRPVLITDKRFEKYHGSWEGMETHIIRTSTLHGGIIRKIASVCELGLGYMQARGLLRRISPAVIVGFGGYPSFPTMLAAVHGGYRTIIHEQNSLLGKANHVLAGKVTVIATSFPEMVGLEREMQHKTVLTGNPVRPGILALRDMNFPALSEEGTLRILITGGSQGASVFSEVVPEAIARLPLSMRKRIRIDQQCREKDIAQTRQRYEELGVSADMETFFTDMPVRIAAAHLIICRSGASTLAETTVAGRPVIMVPYPHSLDNHQMINATALEDAGGGWVMPQEAFTAEALSARIESFLNLPHILQEAAEKAGKQGRPDASKYLADLVEQVAGNKNTPDDSVKQQGEKAA